MRKYFILVLLLVFAVGSSQGTLKYNGLMVKAGLPYDYGYDTIPTPTPPDPDDDSITVLRDLDFDMFAVQDVMLYDTVDKIEGAYDIFVDAAGGWGPVDVTFDWWNVVSLSGDRVSEMIYPVDQCCFEYNDDNLDLSAYLGTAGGLRYYIDGFTTYNYLALSWNVYLASNFGDAMPTTGGIKMMGLYNPSSGSRDSRVAFHELENVGNDSITIKFYDFIYASDAATSITGPSTDWGTGSWGSANSTRYDTIPQGKWVNLTMIVYSGTVGSANGWHALYKDREFMGMKTGIRWHSSADGGQVDFRAVTVELDAGGSSSVSYNFLEDSELWIDNVVVWQFDSMDEFLPYEGQTIVLPVAAEYPKTGNPE